MKPTVGILSGYLAGAYEGEVLSAVVRVVSAAGGRVVAVQTAGAGSDYHQGITLKDLAHVGWGAMCGVVSVANAVPSEYLDDLREAGKAIVAIGNEEPGVCWPTVVTDNAGGAKAAVEHLVSHGHTRIGFVGCLDQFDLRERFAGYRAALEGHAIELAPEWVYAADNNFEHGAVRAARKMLTAGMPTTALFAATDLNGIGVMRALRQAGLALPEDQAFAGFDDQADSVLFSPSLSTVAQDRDRLGSLAAELLLRQLDGEAVAAERYEVPAPFLIRQSCGCQGWEGLPSRQSCSGEQGGVSRFLVSFDDTVAPGRGTNVAPVGDLVAEMEGIYQVAAVSGPEARDLIRLSEICQDIYTRRPGRATYEAIVALACALGAPHGRALARADPTSDQPGGAGAAVVPAPSQAAEASTSAPAAPAASPGPAGVAQCREQVRLSLARALLDVRNSGYYELRKAIRDEYQITLDLLNNQSQDPRLLRWLANTEAQAGLLALWSGEDAGGEEGSVPVGKTEAPRLDIVGEYQATGRRGGLGHREVTVEEFPPVELFGAEGEAPMVCVFPLRSAGTDWGFLAIAQPESSHLDQEAYFMWSALFSQALDHRAVLRRLRRRSEDLQRSYEREREMARAVRESEERYALAAEAANDGLWDWDLDAGTVYYSPRWKEMLGVGEAAVWPVPGSWLERVHADDVPMVRYELAELKSGKRRSMLNEHRIRTADGNHIWALCRALAVPGDGRPASRIVGSLTDVTERRALEERLRHQALYDGLTGLANRDLFMDRLSHAIAASKRRPDFAYTVLWLDVDNFKALNDTRGHLFGDRLLVEIAQRIRAQVRETDTAARFGGDEFVVLLQDAKDVPDTGVIERLARHLGEPYEIEGAKVAVTTSIGVAMSTAGFDRPDDMLRAADSAMYRAKAARRAELAGTGSVAL